MPKRMQRDQVFPFAGSSRTGSRILPVCLMLVLGSCAFDHRVLAPEVIPPQARQAMFIDPARKDTTYITLSGANWQPSFLDRRKQPRTLPYAVESVVIQSVADRSLNAWIMRPTVSSEKDISILFLHGNGGNITTEYEAMVPMVERGFRVMLFDYGGYGLSTGDASRKFLLDDAKAALHYLRSRPDESGRRAVVYGQSLGGHLAVLLAAGSTDKFDGLVIEGAFTSHDDIAAEASGLGILARVLMKNGPSAERAIKDVRVPVLIIHSDEDRTIPYAMGQELFSRANQPKELYTVHGRHCAAPILYADSIATRIIGSLASAIH